jgi:hypothetical protein
MKRTWLILLGLLLFVAPAAEAQFSYTTNADGISITITGYIGVGGAVTIPAATNGVAVTMIGTNAFYNRTHVSSVTIPGSVTSIGIQAFEFCTSLTNIVIPNSVTIIGVLAFFDTGLTSVMIPGSVTNIGTSAFDYCTSLTNAIIASGVTSIGESMFYECSSLRNVTIPGSVTTIGAYAFGSCTSLTNANIENGLTSIGEEMFFDCKGLTSVTIPGSVTNIGSSAFGFCTSLTNATIDNGVTSIGEDMFYVCTNLTSITIPGSVTSIGAAAFDATGLTSVTIPGRVTNIGSSAFGFCTSLTNATIENGVTSIGEGMFYVCTNLTSITIPGSVTSIGDYAFYDTGLTSVTIPGSVTSIGAYDFSGCTSLTNATIDNGVTSIGEHMFYDCIDLTRVTIADSVTNIGAGAFTDCTSLTSVTIPGSVISIGDNAFDATGLTSVTIPGRVTNIGSSAFGFCTSLTNATIDNGVTSIGEGSFYDTGLTSATIPGSVTNIEYGAFAACTSLIAITVDSRNSFYSSVNGVLFDKSQSTLVEYPGGLGRSYTIPGSVTSIGAGAFTDCTSLTSVTIPGSVISIGAGAFFDCTGLTSVTIPSSVNSIGAEAFSFCTGLTSVYFNGNAPSADSSVFFYYYSYDNATIYYLPGTTGWSSPFAGLPAVLWNPVSSPPSIINPPTSQTAEAGHNVSLAVIVAGSLPLNYQWQFNRKIITNATNATLTLNSVGAGQSGGYSVVVANAYGSVNSDTASLAVVTDGANGTLPEQIIAPICPLPQQGEHNLVLVTHGCLPSFFPPDPPQWVSDMCNAIQAHVPSDWRVVPYFWADKAWAEPPELLPWYLWDLESEVMPNAKRLGVQLGTQLAAQSWQHVHLIGHSAGAALIQTAADTLRRLAPGIEIHTTFLDPYLDLDYSGKSWYGQNSDWADCYYAVDTATGSYTDGPLANGFNVDVTWVDPAAEVVKIPCASQTAETTPPVLDQFCSQMAYSSHDWPHDFYSNSVVGANKACATSYGFPLSKEGGGWANRASFSIGNASAFPCGMATLSQNQFPTTIGNQIQFSLLPNAMSITGVNFIGNSGASLRADEPAWLAVGVTITNAANFIQFDGGFTDPNETDGLLTVYWNTDQIGAVDERVASLGLQTYRFALPATVSRGIYSLSFRLDAFSDATSLAITNVSTGFVGFTNSIVLQMTPGSNGPPVLQLSATAGYNYLVQSSTNLLDWTPSAVLVNTNGAVLFADPTWRNSTARFYRAVVP